MVSMTIRNVPDDARDRLAERADRAGQSLQEYMRGALIEIAQRPSPDDFIAQARVWAEGSGVTSRDILDALREARGQE